MEREPIEITQASAVSIAKWRIKELLKTGNIPMFQRLGMQASLAQGGGVDQIGEMLYSMGIRLSIDGNNPEHFEWIKQGSVVVEKK